MEKNQRTDYNIPTISFKSGLILIASSLVSTVVFPLLLSIFGIDNRFGVVIGNSLITSLQLHIQDTLLKLREVFLWDFLDCIFYLLYHLQ